MARKKKKRGAASAGQGEMGDAKPKAPARIGTSLGALLGELKDEPPSGSASAEAAAGTARKGRGTGKGGFAGAKPGEAQPAKAKSVGVSRRPAAPARDAEPPRRRPSDELSGDDLIAFRRAVGGARPIHGKAPPRVASAPAAADGSGALRAEEDAARERLARLVGGGVNFEIVRDGPFVRGWRAGLPESTARRLGEAGVVPEATLDLHGMTADEAARATVKFLRGLVRRGGRRARLVTGKGLHSEGGMPVLADRVIDELTNGGAAPVVRAFATAPARLGGSGALIVELTT